MDWFLYDYGLRHERVKLTQFGRLNEYIANFFLHVAQLI